MQMMRTDEELVRLALAGDKEAFNELAGRYRSAAFGVAFGKLGDWEAARDCAQDALVRAYLELSSLRDHSKFAGWFYQIALNTALAAGRKQRYHTSIDDLAVSQQSDGPDPLESLQKSERARRVRDALAQLAEPERLTLILHYVDGYSHEEIGGMTGTSVPSVKNRIYRARRKLRQEMLEMVEKSLKDERSPDVKDAGVMVEWFGLSCHSLCNHYLLGGEQRRGAVEFERAMALSGRFVKWREEKGLAGFTVDIITGYTNRLPEFVETLEFNRKHGSTEGLFFPNGMKMMTEGKIREMLSGLRSVQVKGLWLTFYGSREHHDRFVSRQGDFDQLMLIARLAGEYGIERWEGVPLLKGVIGGLPDLVDSLDTLPQPAGRFVYLLDYRGFSKRLEAQRPTVDDLERIPERLHQYLRNQRAKPHKTEAEWVERIAAGNYARKTERYYVLPVWEENAGWLESSDCDAILSDIREQDDRTYQAIPSLPTLAELYGKKKGRKLYWGRDLEWKWIDQHLKAHPEIDPGGIFDDLRVSILWR